jgi:hypothetical protein
MLISFLPGVYLCFLFLSCQAILTSGARAARFDCR